MVEHVTEWTKTGRGLMAHKFVVVDSLIVLSALTRRILISGFDAGIKLRPNENELRELGPEFQTRWEKYFASAPDKPVVWIAPVAAASSVYSSTKLSIALIPVIGLLGTRIIRPCLYASSLECAVLL